jgi:hypothetical protein
MEPGMDVVILSVMVPPVVQTIVFMVLVRLAILIGVLEPVT